MLDFGRAIAYASTGPWKRLSAFLSRALTNLGWFFHKDRASIFLSTTAVAVSIFSLYESSFRVERSVRVRITSLDSSFYGASVGYLLLFRRKLQKRVQTPPQVDVDSLVGVLAVPQEPLEPGAVGRVEVRGSTWNARNLGTAALNPGQRCLVVSVDGLLLGVRPE